MKFAIIGGSGAMGKWLACSLISEGQQVMITGRNHKKLLAVAADLGASATSNVEAVRQSEAVIISVPPDQFEAVVKEIAPHTRPRQVVADITSVKMGPMDIMHRYLPEAIVLGTHPVFGPGAKGWAGQNVVLTPTSEQERALAAQVKRLLEDHGAHASIMSPQEHDRAMTVVLGLAHYIAIVSADALLSFDDFSGLKNVGGTTFRLLYTLVESVLSEDPQLYASLQMSLPGLADVEGAYQRNAAEWAGLVRHRDRESFARRMAALREKLEKTDPSFRKAYEDMYRITRQPDSH